MRQFKDFADERNKGWCVFCGGRNETRDHVPSRVLLDEPYPDDIPVVPSCHACNTSFSKDEEYLACLVECALVGSIEVATVRSKVAKIFRHSPALMTMLGAARSSNEDGIVWAIEGDRVANVILKLARGHVAFEQNEPQLEEPAVLWFQPLHTLSETELDQLDRPSESTLWPEVGSVAMIRLVEGHDIDESGWIVVQPNRYRYRVQGFVVQMVIREYLFAEVKWE